MSDTSLIGTFTNTINGAVRTLTITSEDTAAGTVAGSWSSTINGTAVAFPVSGTRLSGNASNSSQAVFFSLAGGAAVSATGQQPPVMRSVNAITGYAEPGSTSQGVDQLYITVSWGEDRPGNAKDTGAWSPSYLTRT